MAAISRMATMERSTRSMALECTTITTAAKNEGSQMTTRCKMIKATIAPLKTATQSRIETCMLLEATATRSFHKWHRQARQHLRKFANLSRWVVQAQATHLAGLLQIYHRKFARNRRRDGVGSNAHSAGTSKHLYVLLARFPVDGHLFVDTITT